jgi:DegV family protein with EDD domain
MTIAIVTDSTCDLPASVAAEYGITVVPCYINIGQESYLDGIEMSRQEFYEKLPEFKSVPTTSAPGIGSFVHAYKALALQGAKAIISIHIAGKLSNIFNVAKLAAESFNEIPVIAIDSQQISMGLGFLAIAASKAARAGSSVAAIVEMIKGMIPNVYLFASLDTIEFLRRSGRLSRLQANLGSLLRINPLVSVYKGEVGLEPVRTIRRSIERLVQHVSKLGSIEELALVHTHALEKAEEFKSTAQSFLPKGKIPLLAEVTPAIGVHVGPNAIGLICVTNR